MKTVFEELKARALNWIANEAREWLKHATMEDLGQLPAVALELYPVPTVQVAGPEVEVSLAPKPRASSSLHRRARNVAFRARPVA